MMDNGTGEIAFDSGESVGPALTLKVFLASPLAGGSASPVPGGSPWSIFNLGSRDIGGQMFVATLRFEDDALRMVELSMAPATASSSWDDWSEEKELAAKARHDVWLEAQLGSLPWWRPWGEVTSSYDPRGGASTIQIIYFARAPVAALAARAVTMDASTGDLSLDTGERIGPRLTRTGFLASPLAGGATLRAHPGAGQWSAFAVHVGQPGGQAFSLALYFDGETLRQIVLSIIGSHEPPAADYRRELTDDAALARLVRTNERARKARHDAWLQAQLGAPPWSYKWGTIASSYNASACQGTISVAYR
jgi:hypothetical protein